MKQLNKQDVEQLNTGILAVTGKIDYFGKKDQLRELEKEGKKLILREKEITFFMHDGKPVPTLKLLLKENLLKLVTVDMGAVKFVAGGADVMRPGIKAIDAGVNNGDFVVVVDETHKKPLAVCQALFSGDDIMKMEKGKVLKSVHHVGDELWKIEV